MRQDPAGSVGSLFSRFFSLSQTQIPVLKREKPHFLNPKPVGRTDRSRKVPPSRSADARRSSSRVFVRSMDEAVRSYTETLGLALQ